MAGYDFEQQGVCEDVKSCLGAKLQKLAPISRRQEEILAELESDTEDYPDGAVLFERGGPAEELFVLKKGWAVAEARYENGRRHIAELHHPGDIIGISHLPFSGAKHHSIAASKVTVCRFPRKRLDTLATQSPRLALMLNVLSTIDLANLTDRVVVTRRNDAKAKIALFILQTMARLKLMNDDLYDQFYCPLTQQDIGDLVGLSMVHVSRTFTRLEEEKLAVRRNRFIRILDTEGLMNVVEFANRYTDLDLSWLPSK